MRLGRGPETFRHAEFSGLFQFQGLFQNGLVFGGYGQNLLDHLPDDQALFQRRIQGLAKPPITKEGKPGNRVVKEGKGCHGQNIAGHFLRLFLHRARGLLAVGIDLLEADEILPLDQGLQLFGKVPVGLGLKSHGLAVKLFGPAVKGRHGHLGRFHGDITLGHLFRIVEGMAVQEAPDELPGHVFQGELEMGVLEGGVVSCLVDGLGQVVAFLEAVFLSGPPLRSSIC